MRKKLVVVAVIAVAMLLFSGCPRRRPQPAGPRTISDTVTLYYGDKENENFVTEEREITYPEGGDKYKAALEELVKGPKNPEYRANIAKETKVYGSIRQNNDLIVDVSREFARFGGSVAEIIGVGSVVNTLTQFEEVNRVKILVEGEELIGPSGEPRGFMGPFAKEKVAPQEPRADVRDVKLYFARQDAASVAPETRKVEFPAGASRDAQLKIVLEELAQGPRTQGLIATIPQGTRVNSVSLRDRIANVDFSEEIVTNHPKGAAAETMTIGSIVNTLTEFEDVDFVKMTAKGAPLNIDQLVLDAPVGRAENLIAR